MRKNINQIKAAAMVSALSMLGACQAEQEMNPSPEIVRTETVSLVLGDAPAATKLDADGGTGALTWTAGDQVAVYVDGTDAGYQTKTVADDAINIPLASGQSRNYYAIYPAASAVAASYGNPTLKVTYPSAYDLSGMTVSAMETYSPVPMVAQNTGADELVFYHVGGLLRLTVESVPDGTKYLKLTFTNTSSTAFNVTGDYTVTSGGTSSATLSGDGSGNVITYTLPDGASGTITLNVPMPQGTYSTLANVKVEAQNSTPATTAIFNYAPSPTWERFTRTLGRKLTVDFADEPISITSDPATIWKSGTTTYVASTSGEGVSWASSDESVATVNASGVITAVAAGTANITASTNGGLVTSAPVAVYVNAVEAIAVSPTSKTIAPGGNATLTATITHTNTTGGTISSYPAITWTSTDLTATSNNDTAYATETTATATAKATAGSSEGGPYTVTVKVAGDFTTSGSELSADCDVTVKEVVSITLPGDSYKYKFRGYYVHPGVLFWNSSSFSLTNGSDPLELLQHYYYDSRTDKFGSTSGIAWKDACYFSWTELSTRGVINGTVTADNPATGDKDVTWRIPTAGSSSGEWYTICNGTPSSGITINSSPYTNNTANKIFVNVDLSDAPAAYQNKGLGYNNNTTSNAAGSKKYQSGMLLVPDGATITCSRIKAVPGNTQYATSPSNVITYADLKILTDGGCVFLPCAGLYYNGNWSGGGSSGGYWSKSPNGSSMAYRLHFDFSSVSFYGNSPTSFYFPVRLIYKP